MNTRFLIIIGPSGSGKSTLSNQLLKDFPNIFHYEDIDKNIKMSNGKTFEKHYEFMATSILNQEKSHNDKIIVVNSYSDKFINFEKDLYIKIYIDEKFTNYERIDLLKKLGIYNEMFQNWNTEYNSKNDFLYNRENYDELKTWLLTCLNNF